MDSLHSDVKTVTCSIKSHQAYREQGEIHKTLDTEKKTDTSIILIEVMSNKNSALLFHCYMLNDINSDIYFSFERVSSWHSNLSVIIENE